MHPATARKLVETILGATGAGRDRAHFLDPFSGSGTTLVEARRIGSLAIGVDANPLAVAIARAKTWTQPAARLQTLRTTGHEIAGLALAAGKAARRSGYEPAPERVLPGIDPEVRNRKIQKWFAPHVRRELENIASSIDQLRVRDAELAEVMTVLLSSILYKVSRRASDTDPRRVERRIGRGASARLFAERTDLLYRGLSQLRQTADGPPGDVRLGDARHLAAVLAKPASEETATGSAPDSGTIAGIVTSPPYAGTYGYAEQQQLRLDFLGLDSSGFRAAEVGARDHFQGVDGNRRRRARRRYVRALSAAFAEMARVCRPGALVAVMLGDSVAGERAMWAEDVMARAVPEATLEVLAWAGQARPKLGQREREAFAERPKREYLFLLQRQP